METTAYETSYTSPLKIEQYPSTTAGFPHMVDQSSSLPSPRSEFEYAPSSELEREYSVTPSTGKGGEQTSADEAAASRRRDSAHDHIEPPRNQHGKIICDHPERDAHCATLTFGRRCDWGKHMDKHDRPYKCDAPACVKLLGFTYSGGLLRHRREVHKSGTSKSVFHCPYPYCKRNVGTGFTRRENLNEHIRRVHRPVADAADGVTDILKSDPLAGDALAALSSLPIKTAVDASRECIRVTTTSRKRKVSNSNAGAETLANESDEADVRNELAQLRRSNNESQRQIANLHTLLQERDLRISKLEHEFQSLMEQRREDLSRRIAQEAVAQEQ